MAAIRPDPDDKALQRAGDALLGASAWDDLAALVGSQLPESAYTAIRVIGEAAPLTCDLRGLIGREDALSLTIAGGLLHCRALRFRGLGGAETVSEDQWELYIPTLAHAQELLARAAVLAPSSGLTAAWRATAFVEASDEEKDEAELGLRMADDVPVSGFSRLLSARTLKWGGSHDEMWRVARSYARRDLPGSLALIAKAHFEEWLWLATFEEDPALAAEHETYLRRDEVVAEILATSRQVLAAPPNPDPRNALYAANWFGQLLSTAGRPRDARPHLQRMGRHLDRSIWLFDNPRFELNRARLKAWLPPV